MDEYIDRKAAIDVVTKWFDKINQNGDICIDGLRSLPAADVVERETGNWMTTDAFPHHVYCSVCHKTYIPNDNWQIWQDHCNDGGLPRNYCPNCGAKMEG